MVLDVKNITADKYLVEKLVLKHLEEVSNLKNDLKVKDGELEAKEQEISQLKAYISLLKHKQYSPKSEKVSPNQLRLFNEAEETDESLNKNEEQDKDKTDGKEEISGYTRSAPRSS